MWPWLSGCDWNEWLSAIPSERRKEVMVAPWKLLGVLIESMGEWEAWDLGNIQEMSLLLSWHIDLVTWIRLEKKMGLSFSAWHFQYFVHPDSFMVNPTFFSCNTLVQAVPTCTEPKDWNRKCPSLAGLKELCARHKPCQFQFSSAESQQGRGGRRGLGMVLVSDLIS